MPRIISILALVLILACFAPSVMAADELKAGVAVVDITPPTGFRLSGYFNERFNTGTHDRLHAKVLYLAQGKVEIALAFCDLIGISPGVGKEARELASEKTGIPAANILIAATHSHTGPLYDGAMRRFFHEQALAKQGRDPHETIDYLTFLAQHLADAVAAAQQMSGPVSLHAAIAKQEGLSFNRRFHMKDGSVVFNPGKKNPNIVRAAGPIDPDVGLLRVRGKEKTNALVTVFAMHLDTVGGTEYSADYPFYLERKLVPSLGDDAVSLFGTGTCGDINHIDVSTATQLKGQEEAARIGNKLGNTVLAALHDLKPQKSTALAAKHRVLDVPLQSFTAEQVAWARDSMPKIGTNQLPFLKQVEAYKIMSRQLRKGDTVPLDVQVFRLADDVALVGLPGEIFVDLGLAIKQASPFPITLVVELCNDAPGYVPTKKAFTEGSYETVNSLVQSGGGEMLVEAAVGMLKELAPKQ
jgi:hypothetical protein